MVKSKVKNMNEVISEYVKLFLESNSVDDSVVEKWDADENQKTLDKTIKGHQKKEDKKKIKKQEKKNKHKDEPKKPKSAYICFCTETRNEVKEKNDGISNTNIMAELGKIWQNMSDAEKNKWEKHSEEDKKRYEADLEKFYETHPEEVKVVENKIKKPISAYVIFSNLNRAKVKENNPKVAPTEIMALLGKTWKSLSDKEKEKYKKLAEEDKARYQRELSGDSGPEKETDSESKKDAEIIEEKPVEPVPEPAEPKAKGKAKVAKKKISKA
jgi:hypothetical protein